MLSWVNIVGAGVVCAAGPTLDGCMESMLAGKGRPAAPTHFTCEQTSVYPVFEVPDAYLTHSDPALSRTAHLLMTALDDALEGVSPDALAGLRVGVCIGTSVGASLNFLDFYREWKGGGKPDLDPIYRYLDSNPAEVIADALGADGPCQTVVNACTSGADAIGIGAGWIRHGFCDLVIAGGADELSEISYNGFARLMITSPEQCRPFDVERKGLNLGEGAGLLLLASDDAAAEFKLHTRGRVIGYGTCGDAHHLTAPHPEARGLKFAINDALSQSDLPPDAIDFINVHGTGTPANDPVEGLVLKQMFPDTPFSATKGFTGHTLGAAGAIEAAFTLACMEQGQLPPSLGFEIIDPSIGVGPVAERTSISARFGISQSLAFGGNNSVLILERGASMILHLQGMGLAAPFGSTDELQEALLGKPLEAGHTTDTAALNDYIPARKLRRIDHFTRMALLAAHRALDNAGCLNQLPENMGIVLATGYGPSQTTFDFLDSIIEDGAALASPLTFSHSVHNIPAGVLSMLLGTPCPQTTICQLGNPVLTGLQTSALWLAEGRVDTILFGCVDEKTLLLEENMTRLAEENFQEPPLPVGEGAAFFLLSEKGDGPVIELDELSFEEADTIPSALESLWGTIPIAAAFRLAAAALAMKNRERTIVFSEGGHEISVSECIRD